MNYMRFEKCPHCGGDVIAEKDGTTYLASCAAQGCIKETVLGREVKNVKKWRPLTREEEWDIASAYGVQ